MSFPAGFVRPLSPATQSAISLALTRKSRGARMRAAGFNFCSTHAPAPTELNNLRGNSFGTHVAYQHAKAQCAVI